MAVWCLSLFTCSGGSHVASSPVEVATVEELTSPANSHVRTLASGAFSSVKHADEAPADSLSALAPEAEERHS